MLRKTLSPPMFWMPSSPTSYCLCLGNNKSFIVLLSRMGLNTKISKRYNQKLMRLNRTEQFLSKILITEISNCTDIWMTLLVTGWGRLYWFSIDRATQRTRTRTTSTHRSRSYLSGNCLQAIHLGQYGESSLAQYLRKIWGKQSLSSGD